MKFRRKSAPASDDAAHDSGDGLDSDARSGPRDADDLPDDDGERVDLGSLLIAAFDAGQGRELRMQVDEATGAVQSVVIAGDDGALEMRAFAAPRNGDLWGEVRPQIAADMTQRGGTAEEREGTFGTELVCQLQVRRPDGSAAVQPSRIVGINGPRWLLRATFLGRPAVELESGEWEELLSLVAVRRGNHALPVGEPLPLVLPESARRLSPEAGAAKTSQSNGQIPG